MKLSMFQDLISRSYFLDRIFRKFCDLEDRLFERRRGYDLAGGIPTRELVTNYRDAAGHAVAYQASWCRNIRVLIREAIKTKGAFTNFVDIGSGKGKPCLYAAENMDADRFIGVEFSRPLVDAANANRMKFKGDREKIIFILGDASTYTIPDGCSLVFLFNPFDADFIRIFLNHNRQHFETYGSMIAYANDSHRNVMSDAGFSSMFREAHRKISLWHRTDTMVHGGGSELTQ